MSRIISLLSELSPSRALIFGALLTGVYWSFLYDDGTALNNQIAQVELEIQGQEAKKKDSDRTLQQVKDMQERVGLLSQKYQEIANHLPATLLSMDINKGIDEFARASGVRVKSKKPKANIKRNIIEEVPVEVSLEGTFGELAQFTNLVASAEKISRVQKVVVREAESGKKKLRFEGEVIGYKIATDTAPKAPTASGQSGGGE